MVAFTQKVLSIVPALTSVLYSKAPIANDSPADVSAVAQFDSDISGYVKFSALNGNVEVDIQLSGLPDEGGPFMYHIHEFPVPSSGDCYATGLHLNPFQGIAPCSLATDNAYCEAGDLSGKHGFINGNSLATSYEEQFISLHPDNAAFIGGRSVTIHLADNSRIACANILIQDKAEQQKTVLIATNSSNSSNSTTSTSIGAAAINGAPVGLFAAAGVAGLASFLL